MNFDKWMEEVNDQLVVICGMESDDLPDYEWRFDYDEGLEPNESLVGFMEENDDLFGELLGS